MTQRVGVTLLAAAVASQAYESAGRSVGKLNLTGVFDKTFKIRTP